MPIEVLPHFVGRQHILAIRALCWNNITTFSFTCNRAAQSPAIPLRLLLRLGNFGQSDMRTARTCTAQDKRNTIKDQRRVTCKRTIRMNQYGDKTIALFSPLTIDSML